MVSIPSQMEISSTILNLVMYVKAIGQKVMTQVKYAYSCTCTVWEIEQTTSHMSKYTIL